MALLAVRYMRGRVPEGAKSAIKKTARGVKTVARLAGAVATEPFTGKMLKKHGEMIDTRLTAEEARMKEKKSDLTNRYPTK